MHLTSVSPILNVADVPASITWFERLGFARSFTHNQGGMIAAAASSDHNGPAGFAGVYCGDVIVFLCHNAQGLRGGKPARFDGWLGTPPEVDAVYETARQLGITVVRPPTDEPWRVRECRIMHPDGHVFRFSAHIKPV
jgi:uncharacterized glyoxalase superfamily protein PhnB